MTHAYRMHVQAEHEPVNRTANGPHHLPPHAALDGKLLLFPPQPPQLNGWQLPELS